MDEANPAYPKIMDYIGRNPAAVLSTVMDDGTPHGAVVYVVTASHHIIYFVTKAETAKYANITKRPQVALTLFNERESSTLQITGKAFVADDHSMINYVLEKVTKVHAMQADWLPPIAKIRAGSYAVIGIEIGTARLATFGGMGIGGNDIFTQL